MSSLMSLLPPVMSQYSLLLPQAIHHIRLCHCLVELADKLLGGFTDLSLLEVCLLPPPACYVTVYVTITCMLFHCVCYHHLHVMSLCMLPSPACYVTVYVTITCMLCHCACYNHLYVMSCVCYHHLHVMSLCMLPSSVCYVTVHVTTTCMLRHCVCYHVVTALHTVTACAVTIVTVYVTVIPSCLSSCTFPCVLVSVTTTYDVCHVLL